MSGMTEAQRHFLAEIKCRGQVSSPRVLRAFAAVPRERFLGKGPWRIRSEVVRQYGDTEDADPVHLYHDVLVAIDENRGLDNGLPSLWARLFDVLDIEEGDRVVQVGCGTGYYSAVLSEMVGPSGIVTAIECDDTFARRARRNLCERRNVEVVHCDGCQYVGGPADVIIVHAGVTHPHPLWLDSLHPNGRLTVPLTNQNRQGSLFKITRVDAGYRAEAVGRIEIFACQGRGESDIDRHLMNFWEMMSRMGSFLLPAVDA